MDLAVGDAVGAHRGRLLTQPPLAEWLAATLGEPPVELARYERALTHGSRDASNYERLEFLGDRVLGLVVAEWLFERFPDEPEGKMSRRLNALVTGAVCADVARERGVRDRLKLGKQARDDGAADSDNVLGDVMEALIGALFLDHGLDGARRFVRSAWGARIDAQGAAPRHPKSALQEWAAANGRRMPEYALIDRSGPHHAPRFRVRVTIGKLEAEADGGSKQEAETEAAKALLAILG